jgi:hypothetical protein
MIVCRKDGKRIMEEWHLLKRLGDEKEPIPLSPRERARVRGS